MSGERYRRNVAGNKHAELKGPQRSEVQVAALCTLNEVKPDSVERVQAEELDALCAFLAEEVVPVETHNDEHLEEQPNRRSQSNATQLHSRPSHELSVQKQKGKHADNQREEALSVLALDICIVEEERANREEVHSRKEWDCKLNCVV